LMNWWKIQKLMAQGHLTEVVFFHMEPRFLRV
jgi:hypothetical protein